jgi:hypothetical protein
MAGPGRQVDDDAGERIPVGRHVAVGAAMRVGVVAEQDVGSVAADQQIIAVAPVEIIGAAETDEHIGAGGAVEKVGSGATIDIHGLPP